MPGLSFEQWLLDFKGMSMSAWGYLQRRQPEQAARFQSEYDAYAARGGDDLPSEPDIDPDDPAYGKPEYDRWMAYIDAGGTLDYYAWIAEGLPTGPPDEDVVDDTTVDDPTTDDEDFSQQLAAAVEAYKTQIGEATALQRAEAQRLGARDIGKRSRMEQQALLERGYSTGEIEQLMAGGQEAGARSLNDLLQALNVSERQQLAGAEQFGIGTMISGEELGIRQRQLAQQMGQYQQSFAEQRRQFGVGTGLSQQQLAQQAQYQQGQLGLGQQQLAQRQQETGFFGSSGWLANVLGNISFG